MTRINVVVEGQTEEFFINEVVARHLPTKGIVPRKVLFARHKEKMYRGGLLSYAKLRRDVTAWLSQDQNATVTTMVDLYGLPVDFPELARWRKTQDPFQRVNGLEDAFSKDIQSDRFIPYIQLHEFEALLFSDISRLEFYYPDQKAEIKKLVHEGASFSSPELINDGAMTAPSKRILQKIPRYEKVVAGSLIALDLGIRSIMERCPHFKSWILRLEQI